MSQLLINTLLIINSVSSLIIIYMFLSDFITTRHGTNNVDWKRIINNIYKERIY